MRAMPPSWVLAALVALLAGTVSSLVTLACARPAERGPVEVQPSADQGALERRLDELGRRVEAALAELRATVGTTASVREPVGAPASEPPNLGAVLDRLDRLERMLRAGEVGAPSLERTTPVQQRALEELDALQRRDNDAAKRSTMLRTPAEIVQRFGFPDDVGGANGNGVYWQYRHLGLDGQPDGGILFVFIDGRVAWHEIAMPER